MKTKGKTKEKAKTKPNTNTSFYLSIIFVMYLLVGFTRFFVFEAEAFPWFYFSVLNIFSLTLLYKAKKLSLLNLNKQTKLFLVTFLSLVAVSLLSVFKSIYQTESLVHISRLVTSLLAVFCLINIIRESPKTFFNLTCKVFLIIILYDSFIAINYFFNNSNLARTLSLYKGFKHGQGNINIYTASLITKLPFVFYLFYSSNKIWKYLSFLSFFMVPSALLFSGSRTALLSFFIVITVIVSYLIFSYLREKSKTKIVHLLVLFSTIFSALFFFKSINKIDKKKFNSIYEVAHFKSDDYKKVKRLKKKHPDLFNQVIKKGSLKEKINPVEEKLGSRYPIWNSAIQLFIKNPLLGIGYGNYKLASKPNYNIQRKSKKGDFKIIKRVHNDFLEKFAEAGILGGILYITLFVILFVLILNSFRVKKRTNALISLILLCAFIVYFLDAFFNFPIERASINLVFIVIAVFVLAFFTETNKEKVNKMATPIFSVIILTSLLALLSNYLTFKSYHFNQLVATDLTSGKSNTNFSFNSLEKNSVSYPALTYNVIHNKYFSTFFIGKKFSDKEQLEYIDNIDKKSFVDSLLFFEAKTKIFNKNVDKYKDSIEYYSKINIDNYPSLKSNSIVLRELYANDNDKIKLMNLFNYITKHNYVDVETWLMKANLEYLNTKNSDLASKILDTALYYNKEDLILMNKKLEYNQKDKLDNNYDKINLLVKQHKFKEAKKLLSEIIEEKPKDYTSIRNLAIVEMNLKNYNKSIDLLNLVINYSSFKDGKAEFCRGFCYEQLKNIEKSKIDYKKSREIGFPQALKLKKEKYE